MLQKLRFLKLSDSLQLVLVKARPSGGGLLLFHSIVDSFQDTRLQLAFVLC